MKKTGFTLIELLVVVLIIGILAAIALPQYEKAVNRSRLAEALSNGRTLKESVARYQMETGAQPENFAYLDIQLPNMNMGDLAGDTWNFQVMENGAFSYQLPRSPQISLRIGGRNGSLAGIILHFRANGSIFCYAQKSQTPRQDYFCQSLGGTAEPGQDTENHSAYRLSF